MWRSIQKSGKSESSVIMLGICEIHIVNELLICRMELEETMLWNYSTEDFSKKMNNNLFFQDEIEIFYNLVIRDEIEIFIF